MNPRIRHSEFLGSVGTLAALTQLRSALGAGRILMVDANQAWDVDMAIQMLPRLGPFGLDRIEEPFPADHSNA